MKKIGKTFFPIFFVLLLVPSISKGQKNIAGAGLHEFGVGLGGFNYTGELSQKYNLSNYRPGGMIFYRLNISPVVNLRFAGMTGQLFGSDKKGSDPISLARGQSFSTPVSEFAINVEYNFLNFRPKKEQYRYSPYLTSGLCFFSTKATGFQAGIPIGVGLKYRLTRRLNLGLEFIANKTFTDNIDGISSYMIGTHQTANPFDKDWFYYTGFSISWTAFSVICPDSFNR